MTIGFSRQCAVLVLRGLRWFGRNIRSVTHKEHGLVKKRLNTISSKYRVYSTDDIPYRELLSLRYRAPTNAFTILANNKSSDKLGKEERLFTGPLSPLVSRAFIFLFGTCKIFSYVALKNSLHGDRLLPGVTGIKGMPQGDSLIPVTFCVVTLEYFSVTQVSTKC